ncbi:hypothetical protein PR048_010450 [Dryococelus australis]|uniref:Uncharacterized protein n=1 Tax=Dryococelus australis TaxID=614101 RepID=A0ABQ9I2S7_9NEOP|nr:hypothetical protein PR048_010450 [Dryococelus australis]
MPATKCSDNVDTFAGCCNLQKLVCAALGLSARLWQDVACEKRSAAPSRLGVALNYQLAAVAATPFVDAFDLHYHIAYRSQLTSDTGSQREFCRSLLTLTPTRNPAGSVEETAGRVGKVGVNAEEHTACIQVDPKQWLGWVPNKNHDRFLPNPSSIPLPCATYTVSNDLAFDETLPPKRTGFSPRPSHCIFACGNRAERCSWWWVFSGISRFPAPSFRRSPYSLQSPSSALKTAMETGTESDRSPVTGKKGCCGVVVIPFTAPNKAKPGFTPDGARTRFFHGGNVGDFPINWCVSTRGLCSCASEVKKRGSDTGDSYTHGKRLIAPTCKACCVTVRLGAALNVEALRVDEDELRRVRSSAGMRGEGGNGSSTTKPAYQQHRPARFPDASATPLVWEASSLTTTPPQTLHGRRPVWERNIHNFAFSLFNKLHDKKYLKWSSAGMQGRGKGEIPEKTRRPASSSDTISMCENPGATRSVIEPCSPWWEANRLTVQTQWPLTRFHNCGSKLDLRSYRRSTLKTVAIFQFRAGLEIEIKFISNRQFWRFDISIRDQQPSSTNVVRKYANKITRVKIFAAQLLIRNGYHAMFKSPPRALTHSRLHSSVSHPFVHSHHEHLARRRPAISSRRPDFSSFAHTRQMTSVKDCRRQYI